MVKTRNMAKLVFGVQQEKSKLKRKKSLKQKKENGLLRTQKLLSLCKPCSVHLTNETFPDVRKENGKFSL